MKTCEICGDEFEENVSWQKYCPKCGKNPARAAARQSRYARVLRKHMGIDDQPVEKQCLQCGKNFSTYHNRDFCSKDCQAKYRIEHVSCPYCGKNLYKMGLIIDDPHGGRHFCSEECHRLFNKQLAKKKDKVRICPNCHKEFWNKDTTFCCKECYETAKANGWVPESKRKITVKCKRCGEPFETKAVMPDELCENCKNIIRRYRQQKAEEERLQQLREQAENKKRLEEQKFKQGVAENGLCFYCQATNFICERIKSNFIYYPEDAKVVDGKVLECPTFIKKNKRKKTNNEDNRNLEHT